MGASATTRARSTGIAVATGVNVGASARIIVVVAPRRHDDDVGTGARAAVKVGAATESRASEESLTDR